MNCEQVKKLIPEWLNGETDARQAEIMENHLSNCESCRQEADFWRAVGAAMLENTGDIKAPAGFAEAVMSRLPEQRNYGFKHIAARWRRGIAAAAAFVLVSAGAATGYFQWGINNVPHMVENNPPSQVIINTQGTGEINNEKPGPQNNPVGNPGEQSGGNDPANTGTQQPGNNGQGNPGQVDPSGGSDTGAGGGGEIFDAGELALMSTDMERVVEVTFLQMKVEDFNAAHARALEYINGTEAGYEVIAAEHTEAGSQESIKIVVDNSRAGALLENLSTLGQVVATDNTRESITADYNENVEQVLLLKDQFETCTDINERKQLQVKITGIMAQLKTWDQEAKKKTIILMLEN